MNATIFKEKARTKARAINEHLKTYASTLGNIIKSFDRYCLWNIDNKRILNRSLQFVNYYSIVIWIAGPIVEVNTQLRIYVPFTVEGRAFTIRV